MEHYVIGAKPSDCIKRGEGGFQDRSKPLQLPLIQVQKRTCGKAGHYPELVLEAGRLGAECEVMPGLQESPLAVLPLKLCECRGFLCHLAYHRRDELHGTKLRVRVLKRSACCGALILENDSVFQARVLHSLFHPALQQHKVVVNVFLGKLGKRFSVLRGFHYHFVPSVRLLASPEKRRELVREAPYLPLAVLFNPVKLRRGELLVSRAEKAL